MMERRFMDKRKVLGIAMICVAILIAGYYFLHPLFNKKDTDKEVTTTVESAEITTHDIPEITSYEEITTIEETTAENVTVDEYREEHLEMQNMEIKLPSDDVMALVENDVDGLKMQYRHLLTDTDMEMPSMPIMQAMFRLIPMTALLK